MEGSPEQTTTHLIAQLTGELKRNEDVETAIDVYKTSNWIINQLDEVKEAALELAEQDMRQRDLDSLSIPIGSAGWTEPKTGQLDEEAWAEAMAENPRLREVQREFDAAKAALRQAQEPYTKLPEPRFFIR